MKVDLATLLYRLLVANKIRIDKKELELQIASHPSYPSLHSITGVCNHFDIPNIAVEIPVEISIVKDLPNDFITVVAINGKDILSYVTRSKEYFIITNEHSNNEKLPVDKFLKSWTGIVLAVEKDQSIKYNSDSFKYNEIGKWLASFFLIGMSFLIISSTCFLDSIQYILSLVGFIISILINREILGINSKNLDGICNFSKKTSCNQVLKSKGSRIGNLMDLGDASIIIFATYLLSYQLMLIYNFDIIAVLTMTAFLGIPVVLYSIYYQSYILKKWCTLCLAIATVLIFQAVTAWFANGINRLFAIDFYDFFPFFICLFIAGFLWFTGKRITAQKNKINKLKLNYYKFKNNYLIFMSLLSENSKTTNTLNYSEELIFGNIDSPLELILVSNPLCYYCKKAQSDFEYFLKEFGNRGKFILRFNVDMKEPSSQDVKIASQAMHLYENEGPEACLRWLDANHNNIIKDETLTAKVQIPSQYLSRLEVNKKWCLENELNFTPIFLINGRKLPSQYEINDIKIFIDDLLLEQL